MASSKVLLNSATNFRTVSGLGLVRSDESAEERRYRKCRSTSEGGDVLRMLNAASVETTRRGAGRATEDRRVSMCCSNIGRRVANWDRRVVRSGRELCKWAG